MHFIDEPNRIYANNDQGEVVAEITFPPCGEGIVDIDHTYVSDTLRGLGVAGQLMEACCEKLRADGKLMEACCEKLRADGKRARATCSYAVTWFDRHPERGDVLA